ncbi:MAG: hypothetical protein ACLVJ4_01230 [Mediterraneibacter sp.]
MPEERLPGCRHKTGGYSGRRETARVGHPGVVHVTEPRDMGRAASEYDYVQLRRLV